MSTTSTRIWDLPTRVFHWLLAASVVALVATAQIGGNAMEWHLRLGHGVLALLVFRLVWGVIGGHWSRFATFVPSLRRVARYLRGENSAAHPAGHNPLGALSVVGMLVVLLVQVATGLCSDDEISAAGPLAHLVPGDTVAWASGWHKGWGQWLVWALVGLHLAAIAFYTLMRRQRLMPAMLHGDQAAPAGTPASRDGAAARMLAVVVAGLCAAGAWWVYELGATPLY